MSDRRSGTLVEEKGGKIRELEEKTAHLQMARVGVCWQEPENTSAVSSGTQTAHCDCPALQPRAETYTTPLQLRLEGARETDNKCDITAPTHRTG